MKKYSINTSAIILKGKNRSFFERIFINNIRFALKKEIKKLENWGGSFYLETENDIDNKLSKIIGIKNFKKIMELNTLDEVEEFIKKEIDKNLKINLEVKRGDKNYPLNSLEIKQELIKNLKNYFNFDFKNPNIIIHILFKKNKFYLSTSKKEGIEGLPVGSSGRGLVLLSGGIDSPVASFLAMKRGLKLAFLHFHSYPQTSKDSIEKVKKLIEKLNDYNFGSSLYLMNILELQKFYYQNIPHKFLVIFYRRSMLRLAEKLAQELKINCLITGENLGQVASQTIQNMEVISNGINIFIFRPLLGFNKSEIIDLAKKIGTYEISVLKGDDCCSLFVPHKVETKAKLNEVLKIEEKLKDKIIELEEKIHKEKEETKFNS
jgi:thiamine biosynthesis protein ThiI